MGVAITEQGDTIIVRLRGELDMALSVPFKNDIQHTLKRNPSIKNIVILMNDVTFIDSTGLAAILGRYREVNLIGGEVRLVGVSESVRKLLSFSGVDKLIPLCHTEREAMRSLSS